MLSRILLLAVLGVSCAFGATVLPLGNGTAEINTATETGNIVTIEAANDLAQSNWEVISSVLSPTNALRWLDPWPGAASNRFYRISHAKAVGVRPLRAPNFRLIDQAGKAHELHYFGNDESVKAFVLIFTKNGCTEMTNQRAVIKALGAKFGLQGVKFWMIDSNPADTRATIASESTTLGLGLPVLHDRAQTVARLYGVSRAAEVVCVARDGFEIFYQGSFDERTTATSGTATRNYVDEALTEFLAGKPVTVRATKPAGCDVPVIPAGDVSYGTDIAPILQAKCVTCHSPGNVAPWAMTNHAIVKAYSTLIRDEVSAHNMPPWHADPQFGRFKNDISLSIDEERKLIQWIAAGAPRGTGPDPLENIPAPPPKWPVELGPPDLVIKAPVQQVTAEGVEPYRYIYVQNGLAAETWVKAAIVRPSNTRVVHHYIVWEGQSSSQMASGIASYVPGFNPSSFPEGTGIKVSPGWVTFNLHYTPTGEPETDEPELALWFHKTPPTKELQTLPLVNDTFTIPAGANEYQVVQEFTIPAFLGPVTLYSMSPHMHLRGARMKFEIVDLTGKRETLLSVPKYDFHWQTKYELAEPRRVPAGTKVIATGAFDNSELNLENPDPASPVRWGEQSYEEMFIGYFDFTLP
jgi:hypothetical protein